MTDVTQILSQIESGDPSAAEQLLPLVYEELRKLAAAKLAQEKPGQTLQATALVHEAYLRLVDVETGPALEQPRPFLCGRRRGHAADSGRAAPAQGAASNAAATGSASTSMSLTRPTSVVDPTRPARAGRRARTSWPPTTTSRRELVKLRYFAGLTIEEAADGLGISPRNRGSPLGLRTRLAAT